MKKGLRGLGFKGSSEEKTKNKKLEPLTPRILEPC